MELEYVKNGDYYIPTLRANDEPEELLTKWGLMRRNFLKEHRRGMYSGMMLEGTLFFATPNYQKMQNPFPKVAAGNSSFLHVPPA